MLEHPPVSPHTAPTPRWLGWPDRRVGPWKPVSDPGQAHRHPPPLKGLGPDERPRHSWWHIQLSHGILPVLPRVLRNLRLGIHSSTWLCLVLWFFISTLLISWFFLDRHGLCFCGASSGEGRRPAAPGGRVLCGVWRQSLRWVTKGHAGCTSGANIMHQIRGGGGL